MAERFTADLLFILFVLLVAALLGFLIAWLLRGAKIRELEAIILQMKQARPKVQPAASLSEKPSIEEVPFDAAAAKAAFGKKIRENDLKIVEGIGPKIAKLLQDREITTWKSLAETEPDIIQNILDEGGDRFALHHPDTWPAQAAMAARGDWEELMELQVSLKGGRLTYKK